MQCLDKCRQEVCSKLGLETSNVELSMGMSQDFEKAVSDLHLSYIISTYITPGRALEKLFLKPFFPSGSEDAPPSGCQGHNL